MDEAEIGRILRQALDIRWDRFMTAGAASGSQSNVMINQKDVESIRRLQSESPGAVLEWLRSARDEMYLSYPRVLFKVLANINDRMAVRHCLALIWQLLDGDFYAAVPALRRAALSPPSLAATNTPSSAEGAPPRSTTIASVTGQLAVSQDQPVLLLAAGVAARMLAALPQDDHIKSGRTVPLLESAAPGGASGILTALAVHDAGSAGAAAAARVPVTEAELRSADELLSWIRATLSGCNRYHRERARAEGRRRAAALKAGMDRGRTAPHSHGKAVHRGDGAVADSDSTTASGGGVVGGRRKELKGGDSPGTPTSRFDRASGGSGGGGGGGSKMAALTPRQMADMQWANLQLPASTAEGSVIARLLRGALESLMVALESRWLVGKAVDLRMGDELVPILRQDDPEAAYRAAFCLWVITLDPVGRVQVGMHPECIPVLVSLIRPNTVALKVIRMAVAALRQCSLDGDTGTEAVAIMEDAGLRDLLQGLSTQRKALEDSELQTDARGLAEALESNDTALTAVDRYRRELRSGSLRWSGLHTASFWEENSALFEQKNFEVIRALAAMLGATNEEGRGGLEDGGSSATMHLKAGSGGSAGLVRSVSSGGSATDAETICVACHDLGEFAVHHPSGKLLCHQLGVKEAVMRRLDSPNADVSRQALLAVSKMMIARWEFTAAAQQAKEKEEDELAASTMLAGMGEPRVGALA